VPNDSRGFVVTLAASWLRSRCIPYALPWVSSRCLGSGTTEPAFPCPLPLPWTTTQPWTNWYVVCGILRTVSKQMMHKREAT
jgi:hypothetical protein